MPTVTALHVAKATRLPMRAVEKVEIEAGQGIVGDRYHGTKHRHVTVQSQDDLDTASGIHGAEVRAELTRRNMTISDGPVPREPGARIRIGEGNMTISDGPVPREPGARIRIGEVLLEVVRVAAPCKLLDDTIGRGAQEALRRRGGSVCRVLEGGVVSLGDPVELVARPASG